MKLRHLCRLAFQLLVILILVIGVTIDQDSSATNASHLLNGDNTSARAFAVNAQASDVITFSEHPVDTLISSQFAGKGILFGGDNPFITTDESNPTSPVLSGSPLFRGVIEGTFINPSDGKSPTIVKSFSLDAGYFNAIGSTRIEWFDPDGTKLGQRTNTQLGIERFNIEGGNIARFRLSIIENEPLFIAVSAFLG
jgi:hypothetical protein